MTNTQIEGCIKLCDSNVGNSSSTDKTKASSTMQNYTRQVKGDNKVDFLSAQFYYGKVLFGNAGDKK